MNKKIMFSPVGGTDPMSESNYHDGALLHIARHYLPDVIYLYMSKEILEKQDQDDRYRYCIRKLGEKLNHSFEIREIERRELEKVQLFDPIYTDFEQILDGILSEMDETDELLLNVSSGTPAMKSALFVLATMVDIPCQCIQADTPDKKMNQQQHSKEYDVEERWELNPDNGYRPSDENYNRTHAERLVSLKRLKYEEIIKKHVLSYNYHAALVLAEDMGTEKTSAYLTKLKLADARKQLDFPAVNKLVVGQKKEVYSPVRDDEKRMVYEYMLNLQTKAICREYADFVRAVSPLLVDLFEQILKKQVGFDIDKYTYIKDKTRYWDMKKLSASGKFLKILNEKYYDRFEGKWVKSDHLNHLAEDLIKDDTIVRCIKKLRVVEREVRNLAAHNMVSVSDRWIKKQTGFTSGEIVDLIKEAFTYTSYNIDAALWNSYDAMNEDIIRSI